MSSEVSKGAKYRNLKTGVVMEVVTDTYGGGEFLWTDADGGGPCLGFAVGLLKSGIARGVYAEATR